jgi:hypothetical protein
LEKNGVLRHALYLRKQEVPYLLSIIAQTIEAAETQTHKIFNDYITCCGIDLLAVPAGQLVGQGGEPSCAGCRSAADPPCETGTDTRGQSKAGRKNNNETIEVKAETSAPPANPSHELAEFLQKGGTEAYKSFERALGRVKGEDQ